MLDRGATTVGRCSLGMNRTAGPAVTAMPGRRLPVFSAGLPIGGPTSNQVCRGADPSRTVDLTWCQGLVPTPHGEIAVDWSWEDAFSISVTLPRPLPCVIQLPAGIEGAQVETGEGRWEMGAGKRLTFRSDSCTQIKLAAQIAKDDHEVEEECDV